VLNFDEIKITASIADWVVAVKTENNNIFISYIKDKHFYLIDYNHQKQNLIKSTFRLTGKYPIGERPDDFWLLTILFIFSLLERCIVYQKLK